MLYLLLLFIQRYRNVFPLFRLPGISNKKIRILLTSLFLLGYTGYGFHYFFYNYNRNERIMLKAEQFVKMQRLEKCAGVYKKIFRYRTL